MTKVLKWFKKRSTNQKIAIVGIAAPAVVVVLGGVVNRCWPGRGREAIKTVVGRQVIVDNSQGGGEGASIGNVEGNEGVINVAGGDIHINSMDPNGLAKVIADAVENTIRKMQEEKRPELDRRYTLAHTVFGIYRGKIHPEGKMPKNLEIDWDTGGIEEESDDSLMITLPNMILNGHSFVGGNRVPLAKQIGAKSGCVIKLGWFDPRLEVVGIDGEVVAVALGFPGGEPKY